MTSLPRSIDEFAALPQSDTINAFDAVTTAERMAIPAGAQFVLFSATGSFYCKMGDGSVTATVVGAEVTDGSGSLLNPTFRRINPNHTHISVVAASAVDITMEFFGAIGG